MHEVADGLWRWERRHPEWHPPGFAAVAAFALRDDAGLVLVDPIVDGPDDPVLAALDRRSEEVGGSVRIVVTVPYHVRATELLLARWRGEREVSAHGHPLCRKRLVDATGFHDLGPGEVLPGGIVAHPIGSPRRSEQPLHMPSHRAVAFGDTVLEVGGALRVWEAPPTTDRRRRWYEDRYLPTIQALIDLEPERILVTHGEPVLADGAAALRAACAREPWTRR